MAVPGGLIAIHEKAVVAQDEKYPGCRNAAAAATGPKRQPVQDDGIVDIISLLAKIAKP